jgi:glycerol uptake facilitator-like aquaporin
MRYSPLRRLVAEFAGSLFLLATGVGSGFMGEKLAGGNVAIALLANTIATGAVLVALISPFGLISGAHLDPAVTLADAWVGGIEWREGAQTILAQVSGAVAGVAVARGMVGLTRLLAAPICRVAGRRSSASLLRHLECWRGGYF